MSDLWQGLNETEQRILNAMFLAGASPRSSPKSASYFLLFALRQRGGSYEKAQQSLMGSSDLIPPAYELDRTLVDLVKQSRDGVHLVEGQWGDWDQAHLSLFQEVPGSLLELAGARSTFSGILNGEARLRKRAATGARHPDSWILYHSSELPKTVKAKLGEALSMRAMLINAAGGGDITYAIEDCHEYKVVVEVNVKGRFEDVTVVDTV